MLQPLEHIEVSPGVASVPKADLHLHAEAGPRLNRIFAERGEREDIDWTAWAKDLMSSAEPGMDRLSHLATTLVSAEEDAVPANFRARVVDVLTESAEAGAIYAEVRFGRDTITRPDFMELFREAETAVADEHPGFLAEPLATLIPQRDSPGTKRLVAACVSAAADGLAGVDIIPDPYNDEADWSEASAWAERLAGAGLPLTVHAGEFSTANVRSALRLPGVERIGHGIHIINDRDLLHEVVDSGVALECCMTSNVILGGVSSYETHPLRRLTRAGVLATINTDNPVHFGTNIAREYEIASRIGLTGSELLQATRNSIENSFTSQARKEQLRAVIYTR